MRLEVLPNNPDCRNCDLGLDPNLRHHCIPAHRFTPPGSVGDSDLCVYILSDKIGYAEDQSGHNFAGAAGEMLDALYVTAPGLHELAHIYVANATRCLCPKDTDPSLKQLRTCAEYWRGDLSLLSVKYRRVALLIAGSSAAKVVLGTTVSGWSAKQGTKVDGLPDNVAVFCTYNPAYVMEDVEPTMQARVIPVVVGVREYLALGAVRVEEVPETEIAPAVPAGWSGPLCFDLETEGCLISGRQLAFHPVKVAEKDGVPYAEHIVCATTAWRDMGGVLHVAYFPWNSPDARTRFVGWLDAATEVWGQNLPFDVKMVRAQSREKLLPATRLCTPFGVRLRDLLAESFLYDDLQERGLKYLSWATRVTSYGSERKAYRMYKGPDDPELVKYAVKDAWATYRCIEIFREWQAEKFTAHPVASSKLSDDAASWYSDQTWACILMEESGACFNRSALQAVDTKVTTDLVRVASEALGVGLVVSGPGSDTSKRDVMRAAVSCAMKVGGSDAPGKLEGLELTKAGDYCIHADNRNIVLGLLPLDNPEAALHARRLSLLAEASSLAKIVDSYTGPLLRGKYVETKYPTKLRWVGTPGRLKKNGKGLTKSTVRWKRVADKRGGVDIYSPTHTLVGSGDYGIAYPSIYTLPRSGDGGHDLDGGVRQFRWSMKQPALQTLPEVVWECLSTRHNPGVLFKADLAQVEWRGAAFLSGDSVMLREVDDGTDIHSRTASALLGFDIKNPTALLEWARSTEGERILCAAPSLAIRSAAVAYRESGGFPTEWVTGVVRAWLRQNMGKSQNFAWLYGGTVGVVLATCRVKAGIEVPEQRARRWYDEMKYTYQVRAQWEEALLSGVVRDHAMHLPLLGQSRSFCADEGAIRGKYRPQIMDFPVQCTASNLMVAEIVEATKRFAQSGMRTRVVLNVHDALVVDAPLDEYDAAVRIVKQCIESTWYRTALEKYYFRTFPLGYEMGVVAVRGVDAEYAESLLK